MPISNEAIEILCKAEDLLNSRKWLKSKTINNELKDQLSMNLNDH